MTTIRTTCPRCGEVDMTPEAILLSVQHPTGVGSYRFLCPTCLDPVEKPADRKIVALLVSAGVDMAGPGSPQEGLEEIEEPWEQPPLETHAGGPPLTVDDLISFHFLLQDDEKLSRELQAS
jgi:hypothetical protein